MLIFIIILVLGFSIYIALPLIFFVFKILVVFALIVMFATMILCRKDKHNL
jgi:hypothetical protein